MLTEQCPSSFVAVVVDDNDNNNNKKISIYDQSSLTELSTPDIINEMDAMFSSLIIDNDTALVQKIVDKLNTNFLPRPTLIDPHLPKWLTPLIPIVLSGSNEIAKIIYTIVKIRGYKFISIFLPHQPSSLIDINEKLLNLLLFQKEEEEEEEDAWHLKYVYILLATSTLATPFSISKFTYTPKGDGVETLQSLLEKIYHHLLDVFLGEVRGSIGGPLQMASILYCSAIFRRKEFSSLKNSFLQDLTEQRWSVSKYRLFLKTYNSSSKMLGIALLEKISLRLKEERRPLLSLLLVYVALLEICTSDFDGLQTLALQDPPTVELKYQWKSTKSLVRTCSPSSLPGFIEHLFRRLKDDLLQCQMPGISQRCNAHLLALYHCTMKVDNLTASFIDNLDIFTDLLNWEGERGHRSVVVRDTSLLLLWSLLRLPLKDGSVPLSAESLKALKVTLLTTLLFDREVSIRRGAVACMQEFLGRWMEDGAEKEEMMVFVDPQSISGHLDDPGSRLMHLIPSLETLSFKKEVVESIIKNRIRLGCWDRRHREGLSLAVFPFLGGATAAVPELLFRILKEDGPDASYKHGVVLALSSSLFSVVLPRLTKDILEFSIKEVLEALSERSLHFDMLSFAFLKLLISICKVKTNNCNSDPRMLDCAWKIISSSKDPRIHALVAQGLLEEMSADTVGIELFYREKILPTAHKGRSIHARLASILALGAMPCFLLTKREEPLQRLFATILLSPSIEVRKTIIVAFSKIKNSSSFTFSPALIDLIVESAMSYECDSRGDVGSELRGVSMALLKDLRVEKWKSIAKRHLFDKLDRLRVVALSLLADVLGSLNIGDCIYEPGKFFIAAQSLLGDGNDGIVMSGLISSSGSMNVLIARHSYSLLKKFSVSSIMEGIKCYLCCLKGRDSVIVGRRTIAILIERIFGLVDDDFEGFKDVSGLDVGSYLMDWTTMPKIPIQDLVRLCRIMKYYRSLNSEVDKWCIEWEEMAFKINSFTDGRINGGGCGGGMSSSQQVICDMFKKIEFN